MSKPLLGTGGQRNILCSSSVTTMIFQGTDFIPGLHKTLHQRMSWPHALLWSVGASVSRWSFLLGLGEISTGFALGLWEVSSLLFQETFSCFYKC